MDDIWWNTVDYVKKRVVRLKWYEPFYFNGAVPTAPVATGFIVEGGYILTNQHVVTPGGFRGRCYFWDKEEADVFPVYRDAEHDFGILRIDPEFLKTHCLTGLELKPGLVRVGMEVCMLGNDAGQQLSISKGVVSRLDATSHMYYNTNYIQAAVGATGGSSGSPVVNRDGHVVGIQAAGFFLTNIDLFVPLDRPSRVLRCLLQDKPVSRGTLQCVFGLKSFEECNRLGLTDAWRQKIKDEFEGETNILTAETVLPEGPAYEKILTGDILLQIDKKLVVHFLTLNELVDDNVGNELEVCLLRNGQEVTVNISVQDFSEIMPDRSFTFGGYYFQDLSYMKAVKYCTKVKGVYLSGDNGIHAFDGSDLMIDSVDDVPTPDLNTFIGVIKSKPDQRRAKFEYHCLATKILKKVAIVTIDRQWKPMRIGKRNDVAGIWDFDELSEFLPQQPQSNGQVALPPVQTNSIPSEIAKLASGIVRVKYWLPDPADDYGAQTGGAFGLVVDAEQGLVLVSRDLIPHDRCQIVLTFGGSLKVKGTIKASHPVLSAVLVQYDASVVGNAAVAVRFSSEDIAQGDKGYFFKMDSEWNSRFKEVHVTRKETTRSSHRDMMVDYVKVDYDHVKWGVLAKSDGSITAQWTLYAREKHGMLSRQLVPILDSMLKEDRSTFSSLDVQLEVVTLEQAGDLGVPTEFIVRVSQEDSELRQLFRVRKTLAGYSGKLQTGDIILTINGKLTTRAHQLNDQFVKPSLDMVLIRQGKEISKQVPTYCADNMETSHILYTCGLTIQSPQYSVRDECEELFSKVYISCYDSGTPAHMFGVRCSRFITKINGLHTPTLDIFCAEFNKIPDATFFRLDLMDKQKKPSVVSLRKDELYHPTRMTFKDSSSVTGWTTVSLAEYMEKHGAVEMPNGVTN